MSRDLFGEVGAILIEMGGPGSGHWGHRGRKGKRGGSAPSRGRGNLSPVDMGLEETYKAYRYLSGDPSGLGPMHAWRGVSSEEREKLEEDMVADIAAKAEVSENDVMMFAEVWKDIPEEGKDFALMRMQTAAGHEFTGEGVLPSDIVNSRLRAASLETTLPLNKQHAILRAMYDKTQEDLRGQGIERVELFRGIQLTSSVAGDWKSGDIVDMPQFPLTSWSVMPQTAGYFAEAFEHADTGVLVRTVVPASRVFSTARTGLGSLPEGEFVILGNVPGDTVEVLDVRLVG